MIEKQFQFLKIGVVALVVVELISSTVIFIRNELLILGAYTYINDLIPSFIPALSLIYKTAYISIPSSIALIAIILSREPIRLSRRGITILGGLVALAAFTYYLGCFIWYYDAINELKASQQGNWCGTPYLMEMRYINATVSISITISQFVFKGAIATLWLLGEKDKLLTNIK